MIGLSSRSFMAADLFTLARRDASTSQAMSLGSPTGH